MKENTTRWNLISQHFKMETLLIITAVVVAVLFIVPLIIAFILYFSGVFGEDLSKPNNDYD